MTRKEARDRLGQFILEDGKKHLSLWGEDDHRQRRINAPQNLTLIKSAILPTPPSDKEKTLSDYVEDYNKKNSRSDSSKN